MWSIAAVVGLSIVALVAIPGSTSGQVIQATCTILKNSGVGAVQGTITLSQTTDKNLTIVITLSGFNVTSVSTLHGFHVHATGNLSNQCNAALGHYNPLSVNHGAPTDAVRHVGDWGNIQVNADGTISTTITDNVAQLSGQYPIMGLAIVVHAMEDDLGRGGQTDSLTTGHAGARLGCCQIMASARAAMPTAMFLYNVLVALFVSIALRCNYSL